jgi:hypothetical protein
MTQNEKELVFSLLDLRPSNERCSQSKPHAAAASGAKEKHLPILGGTGGHGNGSMCHQWRTRQSHQPLRPPPFHLDYSDNKGEICAWIWRQIIRQDSSVVDVIQSHMLPLQVEQRRSIFHSWGSRMPLHRPHVPPPENSIEPLALCDPPFHLDY